MHRDAVFRWHLLQNFLFDLVAAAFAGAVKVQTLLHCICISQDEIMLVQKMMNLLTSLDTQSTVPAIPVYSIDKSVLSIFKPLESLFIECTKNPHEIQRNGSSDLCWYLDWLAQQIQNLPECLKDLLRDGEKQDSRHLSPATPLYSIFMAVNKFLRENASPSIDEVIENLNAEGFLPSGSFRALSREEERLLIFSILGWQSMLYLPSFNTCSLNQLAIHQGADQPNSRLVYDTFRIPADFADRPMAILLKGYGNLLPARSRRLARVASETSQVVSTWNPINAAEMNAYFLSTFLNVNISWVDTLALHLDYDRSSRTLSIFRYPSLCVAMFENGGALYAFASPDSTDSDPRADYDEISDMLQEILLSYRLLFGQTQGSRKFFRQQVGSNIYLRANSDPFLYTLCTTKLFKHPSVPQDRSTYFAPRDFPILGERVELLEKELRGTKPKNWKGLIRDRRDTTQYWTFWLVAIFGCFSIILSLAQVIIGMVQLTKT